MAPARTLTELFFDAMDRYGDRPVVLRARQNGTWTDISGRELHDSVRALSAGLRELGVQAGDRLALLSENRPEWAVTDYACLAVRCADVPVYPTLPAGQIEYLLRDSGAVAICVSTAAQLEKIQGIRNALPALRHVIVFDAGLEGPDVLSFQTLLARGQAAAARYPRWREDALQVRPHDLATIIYTSGTTGEPKGVMLTHGNIASNVAAALSVFGMQTADECLSFLTLSHIFERTAGHYVMLSAGVIINYCRAIEALAADLQDRRPTVLTSVPRVYEKVYARILEEVGRSPIKARIFHWAKRAGERWAMERLATGRVAPAVAAQRLLADRLVFRKVRDGLGGRLRFCVSGGAPLAADIARFFYAAGIPILEGYGLTETSPVICANSLDAPRFGSVGRPLPGVEVRIAEDGEILTRGPHVMQGYFNKPEATAQAIDPDGWFHTGDIGRLDDDGYLFITDRKKDIIVTAGGKNIAPQPIENRLRGNPLIANAVMLGDRRKFPIALLVPEFNALRAWAASRGIREADDGALVQLPEVKAQMELEAKKHLRDLAHYEVPKKFLVLSRDLSIDRGELTPKLSVRRREVEKNFQAEISALYNDAGGTDHSGPGR